MTSFVGSGPYNLKSPLDDDTVQITTYHYALSSTPETVNLTAMALKASKVVSMPIELSLSGNLVSIT